MANIAMSPNVIVVLSGVCILAALSLADQVIPDEVGVSASVLARLDKVEDVIKHLQNENKKLRLENKGLAERLYKVEEVCRVRNFQFLAYRKRLKTAEIEILNLKTKNRKSENAHQHGSNLNESTDHTQIDSNGREAIPDAVHRSKSMKKSNVIRLGDVTNGSLSKRLLLSASTPATNDKEPRVAFSVHNSHHLTSLGKSQILKFDTVNINEGGGYDQPTGIFTCPVTGTYFFTATLLTHFDIGINAGILINGIAKANLHANGSPTMAEQSSNSLITRCVQGDHVWIQHREFGSQVHGDLFSHFAGFMLWAE